MLNEYLVHEENIIKIKFTSHIVNAQRGNAKISDYAEIYLHPT